MEGFNFLERDNLGVMASPLRREILAALQTPDSAVNLARRFDMSRQRVGYHMRELERAGCIELCGERPQRGLTERFYQMRPMAYVEGREAGGRRLDKRDRFSWTALVNLFAQSIWDLLSLRRRADAAGKRLATLGLDVEVRFDSPRARRAFTEDLIDAVEGVIRRHDSPGGSRAFRLVLGAFPAPDQEAS